ncbi:MAG: UDP-N-acetylmuramoyl-L-alanine--D-glutamate ligase [Saezia sp.]
MKYLQGEQVLVLGLGISGLAMARWSARCGAFVRVADTRENAPGLQNLQQLIPDLDFVAGEFTEDLLANGVTRVLRSPGLMPQDKGLQRVLAKAHELGIPVQSELDLFAEALQQIDVQKMQDEKIAQAQAQEERAQEAQHSIVMQLPQDEEGAVEESFDLEIDMDDVSCDAESSAEEFTYSSVIAGYKPKVIAITGTNGKTTVTSLTAQLVKRAGKTVVAAGNIGLAMMDALRSGLDANELPQVWVLELSSFQLDGVKNFEPAVATILNVTQDHLDWHETMHTYAEAKGHIFGARTFRVLNRDDDGVMKFVPQAKEEISLGKKWEVKERPISWMTFGVDEPNRAGDFGLVENGGALWLAQALTVSETSGFAGLQMNLLLPVDALRIRGRHNASNALAALALASSAGCEMGAMLHGLREYRGEPHRVESIGIVDGVEYIDDSKGTNVGATVAAIAGLGAEHRIVLILGGQGKGQDFSPLVSMVTDYVRAVVLMGEDAKLIQAALEKTGVPLVHATSLPQAVELCAKQAKSGDVVLLSPACASLDMFKDYKHRAQVFVDAVRGLPESQMMGGGK